jgi:quinol monooxygenase YgiN
MYTAVMEYEFHPEQFNEACTIWHDEVIQLATKQPGFVRMQFMVRNGSKALAIGTWENQEAAQVFMRTGVFKQLLTKLEGMLVSQPNPVIWDTRYYAEKE